MTQKRATLLLEVGHLEGVAGKVRKIVSKEGKGQRRIG